MKEKRKQSVDYAKQKEKDKPVVHKPSSPPNHLAARPPPISMFRRHMKTNIKEACSPPPIQRSAFTKTLTMITKTIDDYGKAGRRWRTDRERSMFGISRALVGSSQYVFGSKKRRDSTPHPFGSSTAAAAAVGKGAESSSTVTTSRSTGWPTVVRPVSNWSAG